MVKKIGGFILLNVAVQCSQQHLLKRLLFTIVYSWLFCHIPMGLFMGSQFCSIQLRVCFLCQYHIVLISIALKYSLESGCMMLPALLFFSQNLSIQDLFWFHSNFRIVSSISVKSDFGFLIKVALNLYAIYRVLGSMKILTLFILPIQEHEVSFFLFTFPSVSFSNVL